METQIPKISIERAIPAIGAASSSSVLQSISQKSCSVLQAPGPDVTSVHGHVTGDKTYCVFCVFCASDEALVREPARRGDFPAGRVARTTAVITDPATAEA